jgi:acylglycerol lipase
MQPEEVWIPASGNIQLVGKRFRPHSDPAGLVVFIHGLLEHSGRYDHLASTLATAGYEVVSVDLRGHGRSGGARAWIRCFGEYLDDLDNILVWAREGREHLPLFLLGHSMGGLITALWTTQNPGRPRGLILSAPAVVIGRIFPFLRALAPVAAVLLPWARVVRLGAQSLSQDAQVVADFLADPLVVHDRIPLRTGNEILRASRQLRMRAHLLVAPLLILHGTADRICSLRGSQLLFERARTNDKTLRIYPGFYHDLFHEPDAAQVIGDLLQWLNRRSDRAAGI